MTTYRARIFEDYATSVQNAGDRFDEAAGLRRGRACHSLGLWQGIRALPRICNLIESGTAGNGILTHVFAISGFKP